MKWIKPGCPLPQNQSDLKEVLYFIQNGTSIGTITPGLHWMGEIRVSDSYVSNTSCFQPGERSPALFDNFSTPLILPLNTTLKCVLQKAASSGCWVGLCCRTRRRRTYLQTWRAYAKLPVRNPVPHSLTVLTSYSPWCVCASVGNSSSPPYFHSCVST